LSARPPERAYRYYDLVVGGFVAVLLCSNLIGPGKTVAFTLPFFATPIRFGAGNLFFPVSYIFDDVLTEVYGYARARRAIWAGFGGMLFATVMATVIIRLPPDPTSAYNGLLQPALEVVFGNTWRITLASLFAFWVGDFVNSYVLAKMKILTRGRHLWTRTIGSTVVGELADSVLFYPIAFAGLWGKETLVSAVIFNWAFKVAVEVAFTPLTYLVVAAFKKVEHEDFYDLGTNFTPFSLKG
jgi:uncharacterized integral membrane protein (TIGR00697 family)